MAFKYIPLPNLSEQEIERFFKKVGIGLNEQCWKWQGSNDGKHGYGRIAFRGKTYISSRVSYFIHYGFDPKSLMVCHKCDNPPCVNPHHLFIGTRRTNMTDRDLKGRNNIPKGEAHYLHRFTEKDVIQIRTLYKNGAMQHEIAEVFNTSQSVIKSIVNGKTWKHVAFDWEGSHPGDRHYYQRNPDKVLRGESNGSSKLSESDVREIRQLCASGISQAKVGKQFGICQQGVWGIVHRKKWAHVL